MVDSQKLHETGTENSELKHQKSKSQNYLFQINREGTFESQSKYYYSNEAMFSFQSLENLEVKRI